MEAVSFQVAGFAVPKGSFTPTRNGGFRPQGSPERINAWRGDVRLAARQAMGDRQPFTGAIRLTADVTLPYPRSSVRKYQLGWLPHTKKPDADKLLRSICDHLTGIVWADDSQVCFFHISKSYAWDDMPGAWIEVCEMDEEWLKVYATRRQMLRDAISTHQGSRS
jgi:Holliday junction resolvase RusA-like endonuclease